MLRNQSPPGWDEDRDLNMALRSLTEHQFQVLVHLAPESRQLARRWVHHPVTGTWNQVTVSFSPAGFELAIVEEVPAHNPHTRFQGAGSWTDPTHPTRTSIAERAITMARLLAGKTEK